MVIQKIGEIDIKKIQQEIQQFNLTDRQIPLQGRTRDDISGAAGKMAELGAPEQYYTELLYDSCLYINSVITQFDMIRTRIMNLPPYSCYSYHQDGSVRVHIPVITEAGCFLAIDKTLYELPADGSVFLVDTTRFHTAINGSYTPGFIRTHIVGAYHGLERTL